jgi:hypothetical protein
MAVGSEGDVERLCPGRSGQQLDSVVGICGAHLYKLPDRLCQSEAKKLRPGQTDRFDAQTVENTNHAQIVFDGKLGELSSFVAGR